MDESLAKSPLLASLFYRAPAPFSSRTLQLAMLLSIAKAKQSSDGEKEKNVRNWRNWRQKKREREKTNDFSVHTRVNRKYIFFYFLSNEVRAIILVITNAWLQKELQMIVNIFEHLCFGSIPPAPLQTQLFGQKSGEEEGEEENWTEYLVWWQSQQSTGTKYSKKGRKITVLTICAPFLQKVILWQMIILFQYRTCVVLEFLCDF